MIFLYRISDGFQKTIDSSTSQIINKNKPNYITKKKCLLNFIKVFSNDFLYIIADNVSDNTYKWLCTIVTDESRIIRTDIGNGAGSFNVALEIALRLDDDNRIYFIEDDYLHDIDSAKLLNEGLDIADYVTLYDHPDKYVNAGETVNNCVGNPYIQDNSEITRVYLTKSSHWKITNSTTMTFATSVKTLKRDQEVIKKYTSGEFPHDFHMFQELIKNNRRKLISCIPGRSTHGETAYLTQLVNWESV